MPDPFAFPLWDSHYAGQWRGIPSARVLPHYRLGAYRLDPVQRGDTFAWTLRRVRLRFRPARTFVRQALSPAAAIEAARDRLREKYAYPPDSLGERREGDALREWHGIIARIVTPEPYLPPPRRDAAFRAIRVDDVPDRVPV